MLVAESEEAADTGRGAKDVQPAKKINQKTRRRTADRPDATASRRDRFTNTPAGMLS
jgi:hypothetical protein